MIVVYKDKMYVYLKTNRTVIKQAVTAIMMLKDLGKKNGRVHKLIRRPRSVILELGCHMDK